MLSYYFKISIVYKAIPCNQAQPVHIDAQLTRLHRFVGRVTPSSQQTTLVQNDEVFVETMLIFFVCAWKWKLLSHIWLFATPWTIYTVHGIL